VVVGLFPSCSGGYDVHFEALPVCEYVSNGIHCAKLHRTIATIPKAMAKHITPSPSIMIAIALSSLGIFTVCTPHGLRIRCCVLRVGLELFCLRWRNGVRCSYIRLSSCPSTSIRSRCIATGIAAATKAVIMIPARIERLCIGSMFTVYLETVNKQTV